MSNFKKTVRTFLLFFLIVVLFSVGIMEVFFYGENYYYQDIREREELSGTLDYLICGSSHALRALKPDVLDEELGVTSYNLSVVDATMQGRYEMMKLETERNPVKTVILGVSFNSVTRETGDKNYEGDFYVMSKLNLWHRVPYFFTAIEPSEYISAYYTLLDQGFTCMDRAVHGKWTDQNNRTEKGYINYQSTQFEKGLKDKLTTDYESIFNTETVSEEFNEKSIRYLDKIVDFCAENDIQLIMISVPLSKTIICQYENLDVFYDWYQAYAQEAQIPYYDFNLYKERESLFSDEVDFHDVRHMNDQGAEKFSRLFASVYQKIDSGENIDDLFYNSYAELKEIYQQKFG